MARSNLQIKVGTYTGDGADSRSITGVGFRPDMVIVKGGANIAFWRVIQNRGDSSMYFAGNTANAADCIQEIMNDGFQVGTDAKVNANGTVYYYVAVRGTSAQRYFKTGWYVGSGANDRNITTAGIAFTPDIMWLKGDTAQNPPARISSQVGDTSFHYAGVADAADEIQNFQSNGFQVGTSARANGSTLNYYFAAFKLLTGVIACGTYTGDASNDRNITGLGFQPDVVFIKNGSTTNAGVMRTSSFSGDSSSSFGAAAPTTDQIQGFLSDGFQIGTAQNVNGSGNTFWWVAFKAGDFNVPLSRTAA